jgi:hypothetical protein
MRFVRAGARTVRHYPWRHLDVYRPPTATVRDGGRYLTHQRVYVRPPG